MKTRDVFSYSFSAIKLRKLRAGLTTLGVVIGIAAIVALLSITQGLENSITGQLQTGFATDTLIVSPGGGFGFGGGGGVGGANSGFQLRINYTKTINGLSPDIDTSIALIQRVGYVMSGEKTRIATIVGVNFTEYTDIYSSTFVADTGTIPLNPQNDTVIVGNRISNPYQNGTIYVNANDNVEILWTNATTLPPVNMTYLGQVAAVLKQIGGFGIGPSDSDVFIPISEAQRFFGTDQASMIIVKLKNSDKATIDSVSKEITNAFGGEVSVISSTAVLSILSNVFSVIQLFLGGIAAISLLVAGIGIMNIMIVSLMERTREIGILKALGMKGRTVLAVFLCESIIIGLMGAIIGIASGWALANVVVRVLRGGMGGGGFFGGNQAAGAGAGAGALTITPILTPIVLLGALAFGVGVSVVFALYPAWRASRLKPVEALRYE